MISNEETRNFWNANARLQIPYARQEVARPPTKRSNRDALHQSRPRRRGTCNKFARMLEIGVETIASLLRAKAGELDTAEIPSSVVPLTANEGSRGETVGDRLPGQAGRGGNPIEHPPIADGGNLLQRRGHGPHDAAGPSERNFVYTRTDLTLQGGVHIDTRRISSPFRRHSSNISHCTSRLM